MKVKLNKSSFQMDETQAIKEFKKEWATPALDDIRTAARAVATLENLDGARLISVEEIELTKNRYKITYWIKAIIYSDFWEAFAIIEFDYIQAITASPEDSIDHLAEIFKKVK